MSTVELFPLHGFVDCVCGSTMDRTPRNTLWCLQLACKRYSIEYERPTVGLQRAKPQATPEPKKEESPLEYLRQTGRSHRMLEKAAKLVAAGIKVTVVCADSQQVRTLHGMASANYAADCIPSFVSAASRSIDLNTMELYGIDAGIVLFDHYVIEQRAEKLLAELHAYDLPVTPPARNW
jgi:hypothetical protein